MKILVCCLDQFLTQKNQIIPKELAQLKSFYYLWEYVSVEKLKLIHYLVDPSVSILIWQFRKYFVCFKKHCSREKIQTGKATYIYISKGAVVQRLYLSRLCCWIVFFVSNNVPLVHNRRCYVEVFVLLHYECM